MKVRRIVINRDYYGKETARHGYMIYENDMVYIFYDADTHQLTRVNRKADYGHLWIISRMATVQCLELMWRKEFRI